MALAWWFQGAITVRELLGSARLHSAAVRFMLRATQGDDGIQPAAEPTDPDAELLRELAERSEVLSGGE